MIARVCLFWLIAGCAVSTAAALVDLLHGYGKPRLWQRLLIVLIWPIFLICMVEDD